VGSPTDNPLGTYDGIDYYSSPIAISPRPDTHFRDVTRVIDCFGRSTLAAHFETPIKAMDGTPLTMNTYFGIPGLENSDHPDAQKALQALQQAESAVRADPTGTALGQFPNASGNEANPRVCGNKHLSALTS
jgi:hypothetical protein